MPNYGVDMSSSFKLMDTPKEIILITPAETPNAKKAAKAFVDKFRDRFIPNRILVVADENQADDNAKIIPLAAGKTAASGSPTAFMCENGTCSLPAGTPEEFYARLIPE